MQEPLHQMASEFGFKLCLPSRPLPYMSSLLNVEILLEGDVSCRIHKVKIVGYVLLCSWLLCVYLLKKAQLADTKMTPGHKPIHWAIRYVYSPSIHVTPNSCHPQFMQLKSLIVDSFNAEVIHSISPRSRTHSKHLSCTNTYITKRHTTRWQVQLNSKNLPGTFPHIHCSFPLLRLT
jgi:hypothetical protein